MIELKKDQFDRAAPLFRPTHFGALVAGTLEGGHPGRVFVDDPSTPCLALVCTRVGYYFLAGEPQRFADCSHSDLSQQLCSLFQQELAPAQMTLTGDPQILIFYDPPVLKDTLFTIFQEQEPIAIYKKRMKLNPGALAALGGWKEKVPAGFDLVQVTPSLLEKHPEKMGEVLLFWDSNEAFCEKSLGVWLMDGDTIASSCEAVFAGAGELEISIATALGYRRKGLARLAGSAFIDTCQARGLQPVWGCWPENEPSVALAYDLGFQDDVDQPVCFFEVKDLIA